MAEGSTTATRDAAIARITGGTAAPTGEPKASAASYGSRNRAFGRGGFFRSRPSTGETQGSPFSKNYQQLNDPNRPFYGYRVGRYGSGVYRGGGHRGGGTYNKQGYRIGGQGGGRKAGYDYTGQTRYAQV